MSSSPNSIWGARQQLGDLFNPSDYPHSMEGMFAVEWDYPNVEAPDYLSKLSPELYEQERRGAASRFEEAVKLAELASSDPTKSAAGPLMKPGVTSGWSFLDNTVGEANGFVVAAERKKLVTTRLEGDNATTTAVREALPKTKCAHFATHGFFADPSFRGIFQLHENDYLERNRERLGRAVSNPLVMSGLVFAGANNPRTPGRGILTGEQLIDLDLSGLELAVLSASETGLGDLPAGGEVVYGLQRAFHYAGTTNVVASLWKVPNESTAALMALFYHNLWDKNLSPMESLRQAQLEIYRNPGKIPELAKGFRGTFTEVPGTGGEVAVKPTKEGKAHPLLWAAFTLSGPDR
jgi:hypothetical protein